VSSKIYIVYITVFELTQPKYNLVTVNAIDQFPSSLFFVNFLFSRSSRTGLFIKASAAIPFSIAEVTSANVESGKLHQIIQSSKHSTNG